MYGRGRQGCGRDRWGVVEAGRGVVETDGVWYRWHRQTGQG